MVYGFGSCSLILSCSSDCLPCTSFLNLMKFFLSSSIPSSMYLSLGFILQGLSIRVYPSGFRVQGSEVYLRSDSEALSWALRPSFSCISSFALFIAFCARLSTASAAALYPFSASSAAYSPSFLPHHEVHE